MVRDSIPYCTGEHSMSTEDDVDYCAGWIPWGEPNCTYMDEFKYTDAASLNGSSTYGSIYDYGGGGYVFKVKGYIRDMKEKIRELKKHNWLDNRTRAAIVEFSVYNPQV